MKKNSKDHYRILETRPYVERADGSRWIADYKGKWHKLDPSEGDFNAVTPAGGMTDALFKAIFGGLPDLPS